MSTTVQENEAVVRRYYEAWNDADFEVLKEIIAADAESHSPFGPDVPPGPEGEQQEIDLYHSGFSDAKIDVEDVVASGDKVAVRWTGTGTHDGEFMGIEPTDREVEVVGFSVSQLEDGKIIESWGLFDAFGLMQQLGVVEVPGE
jgi:steroid delta-isomerase-like uncharacterized protein